MNEAPHISTLKEFIAFSRGRNFARSDRFWVQLTMPPALINTQLQDIGELNMMCEEAAFPGKINNSRSIRINGLVETRAGTIDYGGTIQLQFIVDSTWLPRKIMDRWMNACTVPQGQINAKTVAFYKSYIGTMNIYSLVPANRAGSTADYSPTPSDQGIRRGEGGNSTKERIMNRIKKIGEDQLDRIKTEAGSYIDPKVVDIIRDAGRILGAYRGGDNPANDIVPEQAVYGIQLNEVWPIQMSVQPTSHYNRGFHRLHVTFAFKDWETEIVRSDNTVASPPNDEGFIEGTVIPAVISVAAQKSGILIPRNIPIPKL